MEIKLSADVLLCITFNILVKRLIRTQLGISALGQRNLFFAHSVISGFHMKPALTLELKASGGESGSDLKLSIHGAPESF